MCKIYKYDDFINEEFFKKIFGKPKKKEITQKSKIDTCVEEIISFLNDNKVYTWDAFISSKKFNKDVINKLIDHHAKDMNDLKEIRFKIRLELSSRQQLKDYIKELEHEEEYEKCAQIVKKLSNR
jgi:hypothetical protein